MQNFLTSDLHFSHKNIVRFTDRKDFTSAEEHTEWLIQRLNSQIGKQDHVYHHGDFCFAHKVEKVLNIIERLNGCWHFILGNHCPSDVWKEIADLRKTDKWRNKILFVGHVKYKHFQIDGKKHMFCMSHFAHRVWWNQHYGAYHTFGHSHGSLITQDRSMDVGLDAAYSLFGEHRAFTLEEVFRILEQRPVVSGDYHRDER